MGRRKQPPKKSNEGVSKKIPTNNSFDALSNLSDAEEVENPHKLEDPCRDKGKDKLSLDLVLKQITAHRSPS
jgi:hypothetical protein